MSFLFILKLLYSPTFAFYFAFIFSLPTNNLKYLNVPHGLRRLQNLLCELHLKALWSWKTQFDSFVEGFKSSDVHGTSRKFGHFYIKG